MDPKVENIETQGVVEEKPSLSKKLDRQSEEVVHENYIRRERHKRQARQKTVENMRNALPDYSLEEIREFRLPYHEALTINLEERGFVSTASYINELIVYQDEMRRDAPPGSNIAMRPQLKFSKEEIVLLSERLKISEIYHNEEKMEEECEEFLKLGVHFAFIHPDWWWLGEQILIQSIKVSSGYTSIGDKYEALSRYAYARFLYEKVKEYDNAAAQLQITSQLCAGKGWTSVNFFPEVRGTLYMQTNRALFDCMIRNIKVMMKTDPHKAIKMSNAARHTAAQACHYNGESKAFILKGLAEMTINETKTAVNSLLRAFSIQEKFGTVEGLCKVRIHLAKAYLMDNCSNASLKVLMDLKQDAEDNNLPLYLGEAYRHLGDYYLSNGSPDLANPLLKEALRIFKELNVDAEEIANVRNLEAISAGLQLFPKYIDVLNTSGIENNFLYHNLMQIVNWKDQRTPFWEEDELQKQEEISAIIKKSVLKVQGSRAEILDERFKTLSQTIAKERSTKQLEQLKSQDKGTEEALTEKKRKVKIDVTGEEIIEVLAPKAVAVEESRLTIGNEGNEDEDDDDDNIKDEKK